MTDNENLKDVESKKHKKGILIVLLLFCFLIFLSVGILTQPSSALTVKYISNTLLIYAILYINVILLVAFLVMLSRNIIRLLQERSRKEPGSRFGTRLVIIFTVLTLIPTLFLFIIASDLISSNVDQWFSQPVEMVHQNSSRLISAGITEEISNLKGFSRQLSDIIYDQNLLESRDDLYNQVGKWMNILQLDIVHFFFITGRPVKPLYSSEEYKALNIEFPATQIERVMKGETFAFHTFYNGRLVISAGYPIYRSTEEKVKPIGAIITSIVRPEQYSSTIEQLQRFYQDYDETKKQKLSIKSSGIMLLSMITLILLFSASWLGLRMAREITIPIRRLIEGINQISIGNLNYRVNIQAGDEIGILIDSFNKMSEELQIGKKNQEEFNFRLQDSKRTLEEQFRYIKTVLRNIPTGVISIDSDNNITTINKASADMLSIDISESIGIKYTTLMRGRVFSEIRESFREVSRKKTKTVSRIIEIYPSDQMKKIGIICSPLRDRMGNFLGSVMVLDDLTELSRAQKMAAWQEVAKRIAHEIKNPLTPIQLSAQRLKKRFQEENVSPQQSEVLNSCTDTILEEAHTLKRLVDEFTLFARMPEVKRIKYQLNKVVKNTLLSYKDNTNGIKIKAHLGRIPMIYIDPEQMKRALRNLIDNSIEAMDEMPDGEIDITTRLTTDSSIEIEIKDQGAGIDPAEIDKIFEPYYSKKRKGTGLGLAIVNKVISDHGGGIKVEENKPRGVIVKINLPKGS